MNPTRPYRITLYKTKRKKWNREERGLLETKVNNIESETLEKFKEEKSNLMIKMILRKL